MSGFHFTSTIIMVNTESRVRLGPLPIFLNFTLKQYNRHTLYSTYTDEGTESYKLCWADSLRPHGLQPARLLLSIEFFRQEYLTGLPFLSLGNLSTPGFKPVSPALAGGFFTTGP